jgi:hypothetical protein
LYDNDKQQEARKARHMQRRKFESEIKMEPAPPQQIIIGCCIGEKGEPTSAMKLAH